MDKITRIFNLFPGLFIELYNLAKNGSRDLDNKMRFKGSIVDNGSSFNSETILHIGSRVLEGCILNSVELGDYSYIGRNCLLQNVKIGKYCSIANDVMIGLGNHPINHFSTSPLFYKKNNTLGKTLVSEDLDFEEYKEIVIENDVWIGARVTILDGVKIGNGSIIASGSVVTKDVPDYAIVGGVPAKILKYRFEERKIKFLLKELWWHKDLEEIKNKMKQLNDI
jgi:acetyltransferase-like isoleucine patch superfamily enzyme